MKEFGEPNMGNPSVRFDEGRECIGHWPMASQSNRSRLLYKENRTNLWQTRVVYNVAKPTLTVFPAEPSKANGAAVIICPGGGFYALSIDSEGVSAQTERRPR